MTSTKGEIRWWVGSNSNYIHHNYCDLIQYNPSHFLFGFLRMNTSIYGIVLTSVFQLFRPCQTVTVKGWLYLKHRCVSASDVLGVVCFFVRAVTPDKCTLFCNIKLMWNYGWIFYIAPGHGYMNGAQWKLLFKVLRLGLQPTYLQMFLAMFYDGKVP